jgi:heptosyltransferase-1
MDGRVEGNSSFLIPHSSFGGGAAVRIVLVRLSALGDIVHTWPLARALAEAEPKPHLSWVVEEPLKPLVEGHPAVDSVFTTRTGRWRQRPFALATRAEIATLKTKLHELEPDVAIDPQGTMKSSFVVRWTRAAQRVGLARPWRRERLAGLAYTRTVRGAPGQAHVVATNLAMMRAVGAEPPELAVPDGSWLLERVADRAPAGGWSERYAVLLPGTGGAHKVLARSTLAEVARGLVADGLEAVVGWGPGEKSRAAAVAEAAGDGVFLAPPTDLEELAALLGGAALVIGGDTGPVHLAASFGTATLAVFVASDWRRNGPLGVRTAVVSGAAVGSTGPSGTARTRRHRDVDAAEILKSARELAVR